MIRNYTTKVLIIGDPAVGKTELIWVGKGADFSSLPRRRIIGPDYHQLHFSDISIPGFDERTALSMQLWNIAGHARFTNMMRFYYKDSAAAVIIVDVSHSRKSQALRNALSWKREIEEKVTLPDGSPIPVTLVLSKMDLWDETHKAEWQEALSSHDEKCDSFEDFATRNNFVRCFRVSSKTGDGVLRANPDETETLFDYVRDLTLKQISESEDMHDETVVDLSKTESKLSCPRC